MSQWYYARGDRQSGPVSSRELKRLADAGELLPTDLVWKDGETKRRPAAAFTHLFAAPTGCCRSGRPQAKTPVTSGGEPVEPAVIPRKGITAADIVGFFIAMLSIV